MTGRGGHIGAQHEQLFSGRRPGTRTTRLATRHMQPDTGSSLHWGRGLASWGNRAVTVRMTASWHCSLLTTQMDSDESGGLLWVIVVTNPKRGGGGGYCPGTYGQLIELPESCMSRISVSMGVFPTRRMKKSCEMRLAGTARRAGRRSSRRPNRWGWLGYCILSYSVRATWAFSCRDSTWTGSVRPQASEREGERGGYFIVWAGYIKGRDEPRGMLKSQQRMWSNASEGNTFTCRASALYKCKE